MKKLLESFVRLCGLTFVIWLACNSDNGNNPVTPGSLQGTWDFVSSLNKQSNLVIPAGQRTHIGNGVFVTTTGQYVFAGTTFTLTTDTTIEEPDQSPRIEKISSMGVYSLIDEFLILTEGEDVIALIISLNGNRLTLEDELELTTFQRKTDYP